MSDIERNEMNEEEYDEQENYITLTDDNGEDISFEVLDTVGLDGHTYAVLLPFDDEDDEVVILEVILSEGGDEFVSVDDDELLEEVYRLFKENYEGDLEFE